MPATGMPTRRRPATRRVPGEQSSRTTTYAEHYLGYASGRAYGYFYCDVEDGQIDLSRPVEREQHLRARASTVREAVLS